MTLWIVMALCGVLTHFCKHLIEAQREDPALTWVTYWSQNIPQSALCIIGTIVLFVCALEMDSMNSFMAFACGVMGNSAADIIGKRASKLGQ